MLAAPLLPAPQISDSHVSKYRPARDIAAFNSLLPPVIEFIEGSSTGGSLTTVPLESRYHPINSTPKKVETSLPSAASMPSTPTPSHPPKDIIQIYTGPPLDASWPPIAKSGSGLNNTGNTCFLNSALQCLLHTPPLVAMLLTHKNSCGVKTGNFCMSCNLREVWTESQRGSGRSFTPSPVTTKLNVIAKHMKRGRQEDSHEFLRYAIDALQKSCLAGLPPKLDPKIAETTWVHKIFGGRLRSRVTCRECGYNSDTFDSILDLSLDIYGVSHVKDALRKFGTIDTLKGADKYKCEKCKKAVVAEKQFTINEAPLVLTIHLKRFSPLGRKIGHYVQYDEHLSLAPAMSKDSFGPSYSLFGVICHAGGGPNSGHYYAHVKGKDGRWHEMNDESVTRDARVPTGLKSAYILFYIQDKGQALSAAISNVPSSSQASTKLTNGIAAGMKKRNVAPDIDEDVGVKTSKFIGPVLPLSAGSLVSRSAPPVVDPQAEHIKNKIKAAALKASSSTLADVAQYPSSGASDNEVANQSFDNNSADPSPSSPPPPPPTSSPRALESSQLSTLSPVNFYGDSSKSQGTKRKSPDSPDEIAQDKSFRDNDRPATPNNAPPPSRKKHKQFSPKRNHSLGNNRATTSKFGSLLATSSTGDNISGKPRGYGKHQGRRQMPRGL